ncbi:MAG: O-methyltransferase [Bacteroidales bacterium]|jgi:predicted O-methyltransferase YrrM|nr:O-methyltransferase [Bacteroidales bacterium]
MDVQAYVHYLSGEENDVLKGLYRQTHLRVPYPEMMSGHGQGRLLAMFSHMIRPDRILEIGTFTGYSAICLAEGLLPRGKLYTIEQNEELTDIAAFFFEKAGLSGKIVQLTGDALVVISELNEKFDIVFIDAAKKRYLDYYHAVFSKVREGGYILIDNILWYGKTANTAVTDATTESLREFNDFVRNDDRVERAVVQNRDGIFILRKK